MSVADTSSEHYKDMIESGKLSGQMKTVFDTLDDLSDPVTLNELHKMFLPDIPKSTISGRLNDLKDKGLVSDLDGDGKREDRISGITCKTWTTTDKAGSDVREYVSASYTFEDNDSEDVSDLFQPIENNDSLGKSGDKSQTSEEGLNKSTNNNDSEGGDSSTVSDESLDRPLDSLQSPCDNETGSSSQVEEAVEPPKPEQLTSKKRDELEAGDPIWG